MVYRWNLTGSGLEFPTPYQVENRFLTLRGYALLALAVVVFVAVTFVAPGEAADPGASIDKLPEYGEAWPHVLGAFFMLGLGVLDLIQASRQQVLVMIPGQPASLMSEVAHEATGASPSAQGLMQALSRGAVGLRKATGAYASWLTRLGPGTGGSGTTLQNYLRARFSHLLMLLGMVLILALGLVMTQVLARPAGMHLWALMVGLVTGGVLIRHLLDMESPGWVPWKVLLAWLLALGLAAPLAWFVAALPGAERWPRWGLPAGVALMLGLGLLLELLALLAARKQISSPASARLAQETASVNFEVELNKFFVEMDRELFRRWAEGIPNRRYARQPPVLEAGSDEGLFTATVLEESQPLVPPPFGDAGTERTSSVWLLALGVLGLALTLVGGGLWIWLAVSHLLDGSATWAPAPLGLVCLLAGGYALSISHLLWSRVEAGSSLIWLELKGTYFRLGAPVLAPHTGGRQKVDNSAGVEDLTLKACVVHARSAFYAAARHTMGSRVLIELVADPQGTQHWTGAIQTLARTAGLTAAAAPPDLLAARAKARERRAGDANAPMAPKRPARFCSSCGTPLLAGARFCQQCGTTVSTD
jgi:hypothetical protein